MTEREKYLKKEIDHKTKLIKLSDQAAENSKRSELLMMLFVEQAERLEDQVDALKKELDSLTQKPKKQAKPAKGKKNVKSSKKHS
jgi:ubiquinone biosynthesis protein UbiJ